MGDVGVVCILFLGAVDETKEERGERELLRSGCYVCERWGVCSRRNVFQLDCRGWS